MDTFNGTAVWRLAGFPAGPLAMASPLEVLSEEWCRIEDTSLSSVTWLAARVLPPGELGREDAALLGDWRTENLLPSNGTLRAADVGGGFPGLELGFRIGIWFQASWGDSVMVLEFQHLL